MARTLNINTKATSEECTKLEIGSLVRSYDFEDSQDCGYIGVIFGIKEIEGCDRYLIKTVKHIWPNEDGTVETKDCIRTITPPVNGTEMAYSGRFTNFVVKVG